MELKTEPPNVDADVLTLKQIQASSSDVKSASLGSFTAPVPRVSEVLLFGQDHNLLPLVKSAFMWGLKSMILSCL